MRVDRPVRWPLTAWLVGDDSRGEFRVASEQIRARTLVVDIASVEEGTEAVLPLDPPDFIVLLAARPGQFAATHIERLRHRAPLARVIGLLGSWCEGELRSGEPWPAVERVYWHQWPAWFDREMSLLARGACGTLSLPVTASDEERLLDASVCNDRAGGGAIGILSHKPEMQAMLAEAVASCGYESVRLDALNLDGHAHFVLGVWDLASPAEQNCSELRAAIARWPNVPWLALASFPRCEDRQGVLACGARELLSKPLVLDDLRAAIVRCTTIPRDAVRLNTASPPELG